ncbi:hypothetical protein CcaverHIS002_0212600 [Cutaneotrichosporon cavernicola]|uniref:Uncharacterized protein n=1 Tax=Cutaneotrichosporon cavernicola TaxID=279322 RepID=A0AA48IIS9_9TREE|nr:uncharacterized protein CcaverHIS019_0212600 [Cutaneotrichosporon cavernicola]BEI82100.1 hypothetical protein CcaverHIS002_0212600 [Cutaneotrichosporon cavernicola]BEI89898.1 hypothetical protein CcaverHIS019_0212600 [Cutaneotrichosporon cavernicola]BEI97669.1 hypothetical protein CcaverHIS631_0212580 [Cutaneotrichosporon cavernicola]BEJ05446.1 hypothetical protein CcaverHIS641_0212630 [Cutaneotrichosporon cavernicola]
MQFASTRSMTLTPLGQRLLALSRAKLHSLDAAPGSRDPTDGLRRGVLVREAIRSAWASLETPTAHHELTSWRAPALDVLTEEDEEEEYDDEERWLDAQLADAADDDDDDEECTVSAPVYDEYEFEATESYTISYSTANCTSGIDVTVVAVCDSDDEDDEMVDSWLEARYEQSELVFAEQLEVEAKLGRAPIGTDSNSASSDISDDEVVTPPESPDVAELSSTLAALSTYALPPADSFPRLETKPLPDVELLPPQASSYRPTLHRRDAEARRQQVYDLSVESSCECDRFGLVCDSTCAPPPLSDCDEEEDDECRTPPLVSLDCSELEVSSSFEALDWKAAHRIRAKPTNQKLDQDGFSDLSLGLTFECLERRIDV